MRSIPRPLISLRHFLRVLDLSNNKFKEIGSVIKRFEKLETLILSNNSISNISIEIKNLSNTLTTLHLASNGIKEFPKVLELLSNLKSLDLNSNNISFIPNTFTVLTSLEKFNFSNNVLVYENELDDQFSLYELAVFNKQSSEDTAEITFEGDLDKKIHLEDCIIETKTAKMVQDLLEYKKKVFPCNRIKVVMFGNNNGIKLSTIFNSEKKKEKKRCQTLNKSIKGVTLIQTTLENQNTSNEAQFLIWDFTETNLEHYGGTLQYFWSNKTIYMITLDINDDNEVSKVLFWMNYIQDYFSDIKFIVIYTNAHKYEKKFCEERIDIIDKKLNHIKELDFFAVGEDYNLILPKLKQKMTFIALKMNHNLPKVDHHLRQVILELAVRKKKSKFLVWKEWEAIFVKYYKKISAEIVNTEYFRNLTLTIPFNESDLIVINPLWLLTSLEMIIYNPDIRLSILENDAIVGVHLFKKALKDYTEIEMRLYFFFF